MEAVIQGPIYDCTTRVIEEYLSTFFIKKIIVSCWDTCKLPNFYNEKVVFIQNEKPIKPGNNYRNYQIKSSQIGINNVKDDFCLKGRTDYLIKSKDLEKIYEFTKKFQSPELPYLDGIYPKSQMFCFGDITTLPFHPKDQFYISDTESMKKLFNIPFCNTEFHPRGANDNTMPPEMYIAIHYYAKFNKKVAHMLENYREYVCSDSPKRAEAFKLSNELRDKIFKALPKTEAFICKPNYNFYWPISCIERWN